MIRLVPRGLLALAVTMLGIPVAVAAAPTVQRTFVASGGADTNPCSIAQPCRSFAAALTQTNDGGEIIVLDSAGYGPVVITKSVSLIAPPGVYAGISVISGNGVVIGGGNIKVTLSGLTINGQGGDVGILVTTGIAMIDRCTVRNMAQDGIWLTTPTTVTIRDTTVVANGANGVRLNDRASGETNLLALRLHSEQNGSSGLVMGSGAKVRIHEGVFRANNVGVNVSTSLTNSSVTRIEITDSIVDDNGWGIELSAIGASATHLEGEFARNEIAGNLQYGVEIGSNSSAGGWARATLTENHIFANGAGGLAGGGVHVLKLDNGTVEAIINRNVIARNAFLGLSVGGTAIVRSAGDNVIDRNDGGDGAATMIITGK